MSQPAKARICQSPQHSQQQPAKPSTVDAGSSNPQAESGALATCKQRAGKSAASTNARGADQQADTNAPSKRAGHSGSGQREWRIGGQGSRAVGKRVWEGMESERLEGLVDSLLLMAQGPKRQRLAEADSTSGAGTPAAKRRTLDLHIPALAYSPAEAGSMDAADSSIPARATTEVPGEAPGSVGGNRDATRRDEYVEEPTLLWTPFRGERRMKQLLLTNSSPRCSTANILSKAASSSLDLRPGSTHFTHS